MSWALIGYVSAGLLGLAIVGRVMRLGESRITDPAQARRLAEELLAGFDARGALVSLDGRAALVAGNGTIAVLRRRGTRVAARRLLAPLPTAPAVEGVRIDTGARLFGEVMLLDVLEDDVRRLEAQSIHDGGKPNHPFTIVR